LPLDVARRLQPLAPAGQERRQDLVLVQATGPGRLVQRRPGDLLFEQPGTAERAERERRLVQLVIPGPRSRVAQPGRLGLDRLLGVPTRVTGAGHRLPPGEENAALPAVVGAQLLQ